VQNPTRIFQPVDIDLNKRAAWIKQQLQNSGQKIVNSSNWLDESLNSSTHLSVATNLGNSCRYSRDFSENCIEKLQQNMLSGNTAAAVSLLEYVDRFPEVDLSAYRSDVFERFEWQLLKTIRQSDGRISLDSEYLQEDNPYINTLKSDYADHELSSLFITGKKIQGFKFAQSQKTNTFEFKRLSQNKLILKALNINYQIDNEAVQTFELTDNSLTKSITLTPEQTELKFWLPEELENEYVSIFHDDNDLISQSKEYYVATPETPVKVALKGPQRLKVVSQELNGPREIIERDISSGQKVLDFIASSDETYFRFFTLKPSFEKPKEKSVEFSESRQARFNYLRNFRTGRVTNSLDSLDKISSVDTEIYNNQKSTYDFSLVHGRSLDEEQENTDSPASQFTDIEGQYRYYSPDTNFYWSGDAKLRTGTDFNAVFANVRADWLPENSPFEYSAYVNDWVFSGESLNLNAFGAGLSAAYNINYKYNHSFTTRLGVFYRDNFGDDLTADNFKQVQSAIWSPYKEDHKFGLTASQRWTYDAYKDTQFYAEAKVQNNENIFTTDYVQAGVGYRQLYDTASLEASLFNRNYLSDADREDSITSNRFKLSADWLFRSSQDSAFKIGFSYFNNFSASSSAYAINFTWLMHRGNYLEDYRPGEYRFRSTRENRLLENTFDDLEGE